MGMVTPVPNDGLSTLSPILNQLNSPETDFPPNNPSRTHSMDSMADMTDGYMLVPKLSDPQRTDGSTEPQLAPNLPSLYVMLIYLQHAYGIPCTPRSGDGTQLNAFTNAFNPCDDGSQAK